MSREDIVAEMPLLRWRGLDAPPYELVTFEFANDLSPRSIPYIDGEIHDNTGRRAFPMTARLFFLNTLGESRLMYPDYWEEWKENLDGEIGELVHPVLGPLPARVQNAKGEIRASVRSGIIVDITWVETIIDPAEGANLLFVRELNPAALADEVDKAMATFGVPYPDGGPSDSFLGAWNEVREGGLFSPSLALLTKIQKIIDTIFQVWDLAASLAENAAWVLTQNIETFWDTIREVQENAGRTVRPTAREVVRRDTTLDAFATAKGCTLQDIMGLNLQTLRSPIIPRGTTLTYYKTVSR